MLLNLSHLLPLAKSRERDVWRQPGSGSDWLPCKFIRPTFGVQNLNPQQEKAVAEFLSGGNRLTLNATKTEFMVIGSRQRLSTLSDTLELSIDNVPIEQVSSVKSLGIYIDENLTWHFHIDKLCKKIASAIGAIKRVKPFVPQSTLLSIYNSLVQSHFDYCSLFWGNCGKTSSNKLQKLQNRAARVITSSSYDVVSIPCFITSARKNYILNVKFRKPSWFSSL